METQVTLTQTGVGPPYGSVTICSINHEEHKIFPSGISPKVALNHCYDVMS